MTTCTPDYLHEDLIDCERRGITGDVCLALHPCNQSHHIWIDPKCPHSPAIRGLPDAWRFMADVGHECRADFPRCEVAP